MKIAARAGSACSLVVLVGLLGLSIFEGVGAARGTWRVVPVLSGSMSPRLPTGSAALTWKTPLRDLRVGSIVAYKIPVLDHHVEMHRVVSLKRVSGGVVIHTKGDANNAPDSWSAKLTGASFWRVGLDVPKLGYPILYLQRPVVRLLVTFAAAFGFLLTSRRRSGEGPEVVEVEVAEAIVTALEDELAHERGLLRGEIDSLGRRLDTLQDEAGHRRRMRHVEELLADLRPGGARVDVPEADGTDEPLSLLEPLEERLAVARAGTSGLAA